MRETWRQAYRASTISFSLNVVLGVIKLVCGITGHSSALIADAIESLGDVLGSLIVRTGLVVAARPPDANHPYGHGKAEPLATLFVAILLLGAGGLVAAGAIHEIRVPHPAPEAYTLIVLLGVIAVKEGMYRYVSGVGRRVGSTAIAIEAWHHRSDALTSLAAAVGITVALVGGPGYEVADDWAALVACAIILISALRFLRSAIEELMDTNPTTALVDTIRAAARQIDGAGRVEKLFVRKVGPRFYVDLHLEVDPTLTVRRGHEIAHDVKNVIVARSPEVADVLVHIEPEPDAS